MYGSKNFGFGYLLYRQLVPGNEAIEVIHCKIWYECIKIEAFRVLRAKHEMPAGKFQKLITD